jgi:uncharacterized protein (DUF427 family)
MTYQIVATNGEILATITCQKMLFDLEHPCEHVIPLDDQTIAATIVLGDGFTMQDSHDT